MPVNKTIIVSVDANTIIHFYRANFIEEPGRVLEGIIDEFVLGEIQRRAPEVFIAITEKKEMSWLRVVKQNDLTIQQRQLYKSSYNNNYLMFDPQDWGEAHAIALGHAFGAKALLTDDTKKSGPRDYILKGVIEAIDTIAFWEVLILLSITDCLEAKMVHKIFNQIKQEGYTNPPKIEFRQVIFESLNRLRESNWFQEFMNECHINQEKVLEIEQVFSSIV